MCSAQNHHVNLVTLEITLPGVDSGVHRRVHANAPIVCDAAYAAFGSYRFAVSCYEDYNHLITRPEPKRV